jgi:ABC-type branched-subunit amino acid transport system ATPase component
MILGPSGTGKSVCIKHMVGLLYPDQGDVLVHGESVPNMPDEELFRIQAAQDLVGTERLKDVDELDGIARAAALALPRVPAVTRRLPARRPCCPG